MFQAFGQEIHFNTKMFSSSIWPKFSNTFLCCVWFALCCVLHQCVIPLCSVLHQRVIRIVLCVASVCDPRCAVGCIRVWSMLCCVLHQCVITLCCGCISVWSALCCVLHQCMIHVVMCVAPGCDHVVLWLHQCVIRVVLWVASGCDPCCDVCCTSVWSMLCCVLHQRVITLCCGCISVWSMLCCVLHQCMIHVVLCVAPVCNPCCVVCCISVWSALHGHLKLVSSTQHIIHGQECRDRKRRP